MSASLVGSEMCIRDSLPGSRWCQEVATSPRQRLLCSTTRIAALQLAVSYTHLTLPTICSV
eukprot:11449276-Alexandrium_andersonii.AAC.1